MKHDIDPRDNGDTRLIEHFRRYDDVAPSAELDARILAAARQQSSQRPGSFWQHLAHVVKENPQRRAMVFASVAVLGIALSMTWQIAEYDSKPSPVIEQSTSAPASSDAAEYPVPQTRSQAVERSSNELRIETPAIEQRLSRPVPMKAPAPLAVDLASPPATKETEKAAAIEELKRLTHEGKTKEAETLRQRLKKQHPDWDIDEY